MEKKCKICGNTALKSQRTGLCSKHNMQYNRQRETDGRSVSEFIKLMTMDVTTDKVEFEEITVDNADSQKTLWQAKKEQEHALRLARENKLREGLYIDKGEYNKAAISIHRGILDRFEKIVDIWPDAIAHRSAGEVRDKLVEFIELLRADIESYLNDKE